MNDSPDRLPADVLLVHSSDLHVDDDRGGGGYNGLIGLASVLETARVMTADAVLLAGDTFDNHRVSTPVLLRAAELLASARVPVVLLPGNHDPALPDCLFRRAGIAGLSNAHVLGVTNAGSILSEQHDLEIWGHPHRDLSDMAPLHKPRPRTTRWQVVMAHGHYVPPPDLRREAHRSWKIVDGDIAATEAHYIALGHWDRAVAVGDGSVPAYYSGSPDLAGTVNAVRLSYANGVIVERVPLTWVQ